MSDELIFEQVWHILGRVRPNMNPAKYIEMGTLTVTADCITFRCRPEASFPFMPPQGAKGLMRLDSVVSVTRRRYGWGFVPRFIAIEFVNGERRETAYFNDGGWAGWRPLLTGSNGRMVRDIRTRMNLP